MKHKIHLTFREQIWKKKKQAADEKNSTHLSTLLFTMNFPFSGNSLKNLPVEKLFPHRFT
jgi:hypothetical protein